MEKQKKELATLQARLTASIGLARSVVSAWIPSDYVSDKEPEEQDEPEGIVTGRPPRLGIGAKFLSHNQALAVGGVDPCPETVPEAKLRRSLNIGRKNGLNHMGHKKKTVLRRQDSDSESDEESRTGISKMQKPTRPGEHSRKKPKHVHEAHGLTTVGNKHGQFLVKSVKVNATPAQEATITAPALSETSISISESRQITQTADTDSLEEESAPKNACKAAIPGDFLTQYLNEWEGKKKKKKKKKKKSHQNETEVAKS